MLEMDSYVDGRFLALVKITPLTQLGARLEALWTSTGGGRDSLNPILPPTILHYERSEFQVSIGYNEKGETEALYTCVPVWAEGEDAAVWKSLSRRCGASRDEEIELLGVALTARVFPGDWYVVDLRSVPMVSETSQLLIFRRKPESAVTGLGPSCEADE